MIPVILLSMQEANEKPLNIQPSNLVVEEIFTKLHNLNQKLVLIRQECSHRYYPIAYRESEAHGGSMVGIFNIDLVCKKCLSLTVVKDSCPICQSCENKLQLTVWQEKLKPGVEKNKLDAWKKERERRRDLWWNSQAEYGTWFLQFGLYTCINQYSFATSAATAGTPQDVPPVRIAIL